MVTGPEWFYHWWPWLDPWLDSWRDPCLVILGSKRPGPGSDICSGDRDGSVSVDYGQPDGPHWWPQAHHDAPPLHDHWAQGPASISIANLKANSHSSAYPDPSLGFLNNQMTRYQPTKNTIISGPPGLLHSVSFLCEEPIEALQLPFPSHSVLSSGMNTCHNTTGRISTNVHQTMSPITPDFAACMRCMAIDHCP